METGGADGGNETPAFSSDIYPGRFSFLKKITNYKYILILLHFPC